VPVDPGPVEPETPNSEITSLIMLLFDQRGGIGEGPQWKYFLNSSSIVSELGPKEARNYHPLTRSLTKLNQIHCLTMSSVAEDIMLIKNAVNLAATQPSLPASPHGLKGSNLAGCPPITSATDISSKTANSKR
jgi:hypothetical protein